MRALVVIDMQNEFLSPGGMFGAKFIPSSHLISNLARIVHAFRETSQPIVWVRSVYSDWKEKPAPRPVMPSDEAKQGVPPNNDFLASTHFGKEACCVRGEEGAAFFPLVEGMIDSSQDVVVEKRWYSAFTETALKEELDRREVDSLVICGVATNVCVTATSADAFFLGFDVSVLSDVTNGTSPKRHKRGLDFIGKWYAQTPTANTLLQDLEAEAKRPLRGARLEGVAAGDSYVIYDILPEALQGCFPDVKEEIEWHEMNLRGNPVSRLIALQGTIEDGAKPIYRHPADTQPDLVEWTPFSLRAKGWLEAHCGQTFNHALIQYYKDGHAWISPHTDKTLDIKRDTLIANLSLGATRTMSLRNKEDKHAYQEIALPHGSIFVLGSESNTRWFHSIKRDRRPITQKTPDERLYDEQRISFTFRDISTFQAPDGSVFGQGAKRKSLKDTTPSIREETPYEQAQRMLSAFGLENRSAHFDWEAEYGEGFDLLYLQGLRKKPRTLYWVNGSIPSWRVMIALGEKDLPFEGHRLRVMSQPKETKSPEFLAINPRGTTPVLIEPDALVLTESLGILMYLETYYPEHPLLPNKDEKVVMAKVLARMHETDTLRKVYSPIERLFLYPHNEALPQPEKETIVSAYEAVLRELQCWERYAAEAEYIAGERFSLADCAFFPALAYQVRRGLPLERLFPALFAYHNRMLERPSVRAAQPVGWEPGKVGKNLFARVRGMLGSTSK
tara:strand:- start:8188 stop:10377 length:2190 start_codon:yes stop_codon:yes gene_type:complete